MNKDTASENTRTEGTSSSVNNQGSKSAGAPERLDAQGKKTGDSAQSGQTKICRVCGDRALSFNFGVVTCESCKAFFRRNGARLDDFFCPFSSNCPINCRSRKHCQKCRLRKCYAVGMRVDGGVKRGHNSTRNGNKNFPQPPSPDASDNCRDQGDTANPPTALATDTTQRYITDSGDVQLGRFFDGISAVQRSPTTRDGTIDRCGSSSQITTREAVFEEYEADWSTAKDLFTEQCVALNREKRQRTDSNIDNCGPLQTTSGVSADGSSLFNLTPFFSNYSHCHSSAMLDPGYFDAPLFSPSIMPVEIKYVKLEELLMSNEQWKHPDSLPRLKGTNAAEMTLTDMHNLAKHVGNRCTKQHQMLAALKALPPQDQVILMKTRFRSIAFCRFSIKYDRHSNTCDMGYPNCPRISGDVAKLYGEDYYIQSTRLKQSYPDKYRGDDTIVALLCAIVFFNPDNPISNKGAVDEERRIYLQLLKEHLANTYGEAEGRWAFKYLVTWLNTVCLYGRTFIRYNYYNIDPTTLGVSEIKLNVVTGDPSLKGKPIMWQVTFRDDGNGEGQSVTPLLS